MSTPESRFQPDTSEGYPEDVIARCGMWSKKQKLTTYSKDQKVDQFPTCSTTVQSLQAESRFQSDTSNGYLTLAGWGILCKEQKLPPCSKDQKVDQIPRFSTTAQPLHDSGFTHQKRLITTNLSSSPQGDTHEAAIKHDPARSSCASGQRKKIAYPFKLVKSGGADGETTLKDINHQILTTPSTSMPIPHSVTHPCKLARGSLGLSEKEVASLTRIITRGREREGFPAMSHSHLNSLSSDCSSSMELEIGATHTDQTFEPWFQSDTSTGYLQDAIAGRGIWCTEQNLPSCSKDQKVDQFPIFSTTAQPLHDCGFTHKKRHITTNLSLSPQGDTHEAAIKHDPGRSSNASEGRRKKIAYPFKLVKSGGVEGEATLKDINHQILTTPSASKPIPHPVKDFVTHPCKLVRGRLGLSGKEVASLTRIHTRGRGSITIIRTKD
ncbi:XRI1 protein [Spatholobus suberectus]|nr:XRI1 protein [Spatholobus suberectus]